LIQDLGSYKISGGYKVKFCNDCKTGVSGDTCKDDGDSLDTTYGVLTSNGISTLSDVSINFPDANMGDSYANDFGAFSFYISKMTDEEIEAKIDGPTVLTIYRNSAMGFTGLHVNFGQKQNNFIQEYTCAEVQ
jgi:hypothetical protein